MHFKKRTSFLLLVGLIINMLYVQSCGGDHSVLKMETYTSADGGFSINMPSDPKRTVKVITTPFGKQATTFIEWKPDNISINKFKLFQVSFTDCPASLMTDSSGRQRILDSAINMRVKDFADIDLETYTINFNGIEGRAFIFEVKDNNNIAIVKQCIANHKLYDVTVVLKKNFATNKEVHEFFNSFQVLYR